MGSSCHDHHRDALEHALAALGEAVERLGLTATLTGPLTLSATGDTPEPDDPGAAAFIEFASPLSQSVTITSRSGGLWWCWVWDGTGRGDQEAEPIAPIDEIDEVARRLHNVVSLSPPPRDVRSPAT